MTIMELSLVLNLMNYSEEQKQLYWDWIIQKKVPWCTGFTSRRLERVKAEIWKDQHIWDDLMLRFNGRVLTPQQMEEQSEFYWQAITNFTSSILYKMIDTNIYKVK